VNLTLDRGAAALGIAPPPDGSSLIGRFGAPAWAEVVAVVVVLDGLAYLAHVLMHKLGAAWRFHRVHHSDPHVDVTTAFRQHPLETAWRYSFLLAGALLLGASIRSVAVYLALSALNAQLEHARVSMPARVDRLLRLVIATPAMHRVHHSRTACETDTNYSNILSFWDRLFGTYRAPRPGEVIVCGLEGLDGRERQRTAGLLALPFTS
jgi:sterol desaturase/sphingolipid hydroxylase (fatty acid hydroxylase superfamily)